MSLTPIKTIYPSSADPAEILCVFEGEDGEPVNETVVDAELAAQIADEPEMIPNAVRQSLDAQAFAAAEAQRTARADG